MIETYPQVAADFNVDLALRNGTKRLRLKTINRHSVLSLAFQIRSFFSIGETRTAKPARLMSLKVAVSTSLSGVTCSMVTYEQPSENSMALECSDQQEG